MTDLFTTIVADPPWQYRDKLRMDATIARSSDDQYDTMTVESIKAFFRPYSPLVAADALLFLWVTNPFLLDGSGAEVCRAWGFEPKQLITWVKGRLNEAQTQVILHLGLGHMTRGVTEHLIVAVRGKTSHLITNHGLPNYFETFDEGLAVLGPRRVHSQKPEESYRLIEKLTAGPYLELFARHEREGWTCYGNELSQSLKSPEPSLFDALEDR